MGKILTKEEAEKLTGEHIVIPEGFTEIEMSAFRNHKMVSVVIPGSVKNIGYSAFSSCDNLEQVTISDGVEKIGYSAFHWCTKLESVTIPASVRVIDANVFSFCENLKSVSLSSGLVSIGGKAFCGTALRSITIPDTVRYMYPIKGNNPRLTEPEFEVDCDELFAGCYELTEINVDSKNEKFTSVDGVLFTKDMGILLDYPAGKPQTTYNIPDGVKIINHESFGGCRNLEDIILPDSVTEIDYATFIVCEKLETITIPRGVVKIDPTAFRSCENLRDITVNGENTFFADIDGVLVSKDKTVLIKYPEGRGLEPYTIPESITKIGGWAFYYNEKDNDDNGTVTVTVLDSVNDIEKWTSFDKEHFIIRCSENSYAHKYAVKEKIEFELM